MTINEPLAILKHTDAAAEWALSEKRSPVFSVVRDVEEGQTEQHDYTMPALPNPGLALAYLKQARRNADLAMSWLIETAIGEDGYDALVEEMAGLDPREALKLMQSVTERIQKVAMGGLDGSDHNPKA